MNDAKSNLTSWQNWPPLLERQLSEMSGLKGTLPSRKGHKFLYTRKRRENPELELPPVCQFWAHTLKQGNPRF